MQAQRTDTTWTDTITKLGRIRLVFDSGSHWMYGLSMDVVGYLCEVFSGQPLDQFLAQRIFRALGMVDTGFQVPAEQVHRFAACFAVLLDPTRSRTLATPGEYWWEGAASTEFFVSPIDDLVAIFVTQLWTGNFLYRFDRTLRVGVYQALIQRTMPSPELQRVTD